jgi:hypothetical protein
MAAGVANGGGGGGGLWSGAWGDQLNNISELLGHGRSFGPLGSEFGRGETASNNPMMSSASRSSVPTVPGATTGGTASVIGSGRNHQNASPSAQNPTQQQQHNNNGWTAFGDTAWNASISGISNHLPTTISNQTSSRLSVKVDKVDRH